MITGERGQHAAATMVGEVDRRETADSVKRYCLELRGYCGDPSSTERERTRPLDRVVEAAKMRREPERGTERGVGTTSKTASKAAVFCRLPSDIDLYCLQNGYFAPTGGIHHAPNGRRWNGLTPARGT